MIDVHCHVSPLGFPPAPSLEHGTRWPCMQCNAQAKHTLLMGDQPFREIDSRSWEAGRRLDDMDRDGVAIQVLSPMPELLSYWLDTSAAAVLCDHVNAQIAEMTAAFPRRFRGLGAVTLQNPDSAHAQLARLQQGFGMSGVEIGSNINGWLLGDERLTPFYAAAESLDMAIFVHALHPLATAHLAVSPAYTAFAGFPVDVAMAASSLMMAGVLDRFPALRIGFSHGGGALGAMLGRLDCGWEKTGGFGGAAKTRPSHQAARMFFDSNVYDPEYLRHLVHHMAPSHIFIGTDYPYAIMQEKPAEFVNSARLDAEQRDALLWQAAQIFLNEDKDVGRTA